MPATEARQQLGISRLATRFAAVLSGCSLVACSVVGPTSITAGRRAYSEAITATADEQLLSAIVSDRYERRLMPLSVASVTANFRLSSSGGINAGFGPSSNYDGNLVPLSVGVAYEENPTISYVPVDTPSYIRQLFSPIPLDQALLLLRAPGDRELLALMLIERLNNLKNPATRDIPDDDKFVEAVRILAEMFSGDFVEVVTLGEREFGLLVQVEEIRDHAKDAELSRLLELLDLEGLMLRSKLDRLLGHEPAADPAAAPAPDATPEDTGEGEARLAGVDDQAVAGSRREVLVIPIRFSAVADTESLALTTRSVFDMVRMASSGVEVPDEHLAGADREGVARPARPDSLIRIRRAATRPTRAAVATQAQGFWYYIADDDLDSKLYFRVLALVWSAQIASADQGEAAPLLTVPVSR